jgi:hypothetical protein
MPRGKQPSITLAEIESLKRQGWTQSDIARDHGCTRAYISWIVRKYGGTLTHRQLVLEQHFPWKVPVALQTASGYRRLRDHGELFVTNGVGMPEDSLTRLQSFWRDYWDHVLEFDPAIPPEPGFAKDGGFARRPRRESDGNLLIRVNQYTTLTDQGWHIWSLPASKL